MPCPRARSCGGNWGYSWSSYQPAVQYYYSSSDSSSNCGGGGNASSGGGGGGSGGKSKSSGGPPVQPADFKGNHYEYGLYLHNWYRRRHGAGPLTLSDRLNKEGDNYSSRLASMRTLQHQSGMDYGENLYMSSGMSGLSKKEHVRKACESWYGEISQYNWNSPGFSMGTGHFTAMVWKSSTQLGIGIAVNGNTVVVMGCYKVFPNMQGQFGNNVLKLRAVDDTDDEESSDEEVEQKKAEPVKNKGAEPAKKVEEEPKKKAEEPKKKEDDISPEAIAAFKAGADSDGTMGWKELQQFLDKDLKFSFKFDGFDRLICSLMISGSTYPPGEKERIGLPEFGKVMDGILVIMDAYEKFDLDGSGTLDPFELKDALTEAGFSVSWKMFLTLNSLLGDGADKDKKTMQFRGFVLAYLLLSKLQHTQRFRAEKGKNMLEDFSLKEWIQEEMDKAAD